MRTMRTMLCGLALALAACTAPSGGNLDDSAVGELPRACEGDDCPEGRTCRGGVCIGGSDDLAPVADLEGALRNVVGRVCRRLHSECSGRCARPFVECYSSVDICADQWTTEYLSNYRAPLLDPVLAGQCAAQIDVAACTSLPPPTRECEYTVVESCPGDDDGHGSPYSPFHPARIEPNGVLEVYLCDGVREWFAIELAAGDRLSFTEPEDYDVGLELRRLVPTSRGAELEYVVDRLDDDGDPGPPVPADGLYLLGVRTNRGPGRFTLELATTR